MCYDEHFISDPPPWMIDRLTEMEQNGMFQLIRCLPPLGIHEHCEHVRPEPSFKNLNEVLQWPSN